MREKPYIYPSLLPDCKPFGTISIKQRFLDSLPLASFIAKEEAMETEDSSQIHLPPGFRFHPSDEELIVHYLKNKVSSIPLPASIIAEIDLYEFNPWDLPKKAIFGEKEWYFFTPRDRKYPNGARPNRAAPSGYWKATGKDKQIFTAPGTACIGVKKALVFYKGRPPRGIKTDWLMHEFRLTNSMARNPNTKASMRLDDWVLCRVRQRSDISWSSWEGRNGCGYDDPSGYFPKVNEPSQTKTNSNFEMIKSYLLNDCPMLPYIFASQNSSSLPTASTISFQDSDRSCISVCVDKSDVKNSQFTDTSFNNLFNPLKRKLAERNQEEISCVPASQNFTKEHIESEDALISSKINEADTNLCEREPSVDSNFSSIEWNSLMQSPELHNLDFAAND